MRRKARPPDVRLHIGESLIPGSRLRPGMTARFSADSLPVAAHAMMRGPANQEPMRVFSVPVSVPFLRAVIAALVDGRLVEWF